MTTERIYFIIIGSLLLLRAIIFIYFVNIDGDFIAPDSQVYLTLANNLLNYQIFSESTVLPLEPDFFRTPGYPLFLAALKYIGVSNLYGVVFIQELIYCFCLWIFYRFGLPLFGKKITYLSLIFLLLEPAGLTNSKLILSEVLFLPFFYLGLFLIGFYLKKPDWRYLLISGFMIGLGVLVRPALLYFSIIIGCTLIIFDFRNKQRWLHTGLLLFTISLTVSPWVIRNQQYADGFFFSGQASNMFANYHVPTVWASAKGITTLEGKKIIAEKVNSSIQQLEKDQGHKLSEIEGFRVQQSVAFHELLKYPFEYSTTWIVGMLNTILGTQTSSFFDVLKIKNDSIPFDSAQELSFVNKVGFFLKSQGVVNISHILMRMAIALFAMIGIIAIIFKHKDCFLWIILLVNLYFIFIPGPMGYGRFRFSVEAFWFIQAYYGFLWINSYRKKTIETS